LHRVSIKSTFSKKNDYIIKQTFMSDKLREDKTDINFTENAYDIVKYSKNIVWYGMLLRTYILEGA